jgi:ribosomal protein S18 acetylase RimI-like enzyme
MSEIMDNIQIKQVFDLTPFDISFLLGDSILDGHRHIQRLIDDYISGKNKFMKPGESLFIALLGNNIIGICGLNQYPYNDSTYGRIRRLYVLKSYRESGIGRMLVEAVIKQANGKFEKLILRTDNPIASKFYESLGFKMTIDILHATHIKEFFLPAPFPQKQ